MCIGRSDASITASPRSSGRSEDVCSNNDVACRAVTTMDASFAVEVQSIQICLFNSAATVFVSLRASASTLWIWEFAGSQTPNCCAALKGKKGGFRTFAATAGQLCCDTDSRHSDDFERGLHSAAPHGSLEPIVDNYRIQPFAIIGAFCSQWMPGTQDLNNGQAAYVGNLKSIDIRGGRFRAGRVFSVRWHSPHRVYPAIG
jgi:hypothetical protein